MIDKEHIEQLIADHIQGTDFFVVDMAIEPDNRIRVAMDGDNGIGIDDCVAISRHIESMLDRDAEDFSLEVMSAGMELKIPRQYKKNVGRTLEITTTTGQRIKGELVQANEQAVVLAYEILVKEEGKKRKTKKTEEQAIAYKDIQSSKVIVSFK